MAWKFWLVIGFVFPELGAGGPFNCWPGTIRRSLPPINRFYAVLPFRSIHPTGWGIWRTDPFLQEGTISAIALPSGCTTHHYMLYVWAFYAVSTDGNMPIGDIPHCG